MAIKFNVEPYYDDFESPTSVDGLSPKEKYNRILFRPGHAVQARELTQIQSMLQHQISSVGKHLFEEGSLVIPGHSTVETSLDYVKMDSNGINVADLDDLIGLTFTGGDTGLQARVVAVAAAAGSDPVTLYVKYLNSGSSDEKVFDDGETITSGSYTGVTATSASGFGSVAFIDEGIYFINNHFVVVQQDQLILDKYDTDPSYDIGLKVTESIQTSAGDASLNDNANGTPNYAAPGAHRLQIKTELVKQAVGGDTIESFLLLIRIEEGIVSKHVRETDYSVLEETLARRTFDESGNYTVRPFNIIIDEHTDVNTPGDATKLSVGLEPGKAYVRGYEIETLSTKRVNLDKARETALFEGASVPMLIGNYVTIENVEGIPDIDTFGQMSIYDAAGGNGGGGNIVGYARARSYVYAGAGQYRIYLFDIQMNSGKTFADDAKSFYLAGTPAFIGDIDLDSNNKAIIQEPTRNTMVFELPFDRVSTCDSSAEGEIDDFNYVYFLNRDMGTDEVSAGEAVFATTGANELLEPFDDENWILTVASGANNGDIHTISSSDVTIAANSQSVTIAGLSAYNGEDVRLIAGVKRVLNHKTKSLTTSGNDNIGEINISSPTGDDLLGHADGYRLLGVFDSEDPATNATTADTEVTEYYDFDNGQRDNYYATCRIKLKPTTAFRPKGRLLVRYEYFTHTGTGDFFTVDSYDNLEDSDGNAVEYTDIPTFTSTVSGRKVELASAIDFRSRVNDGGTQFTGTGASVNKCPEPLTTFTTDVQYYLNRRDKVYLDKNGNFGVTKGVPAVEPELPEDPKDSMVLYNLFVPAYTANTDEVIIDIIDNKRYTMRDIGKLEKRINRLEYYTSLSLLEKEAADKQIVDATTQTQRLKSGFLVDSFASHNVSNVSDQEFRAAIDRDNRQLRPLFSEDNVRLNYNSTLSSDVQKTGALITLPYSETSFYYQAQASNQININPFDVFEWTGSLELSPTSDEWKDTTRRPQVIVDQEGVYDAMLGIINETDALGTVWNEWTTAWTGRETVTSNTVRQGRAITTTVTGTFDVGQTRRGIESGVVPDTINTDIGDRVVEINFAPFIRSRKIFFKATRLKPNTEVFAFFDGIDVSDFVREETSYSVYEDNDDPIPNGKNTVTAHPDGSATLTTDSSGTVIGSFYIPNNSSNFFKTGTRIFKLCDSSSNTESEITTKAEASYSAKGLIETKENVTISTRVPLIERREVSQDRIISDSRIISRNTQWVDPLAQSFMIDIEGGAFLTSIDLFFHKKSSTIPVTLQIREMRDGAPTQTIVPFSEVTIEDPAANVNVVDLSTELPDPNQVTKFTFPSPVYLQQGQEYCFVVLANTTEYELWYATIGGNDYSSGNRISKQPYAGVLFKSQNASTWTADQNSDLKFRLNRATFDIDTDGQLYLENGVVQERYLIKNPIKTTSGSNTVRVYHPNHHMFETINSIDSEVTISGVDGAVNGIPASELNDTHVVSNVEMDWYEITVTTNATGTGIGGGESVTATENQLYSTFYPLVQQINLPGTNTTWGVKTSTGVSLGQDTPTPYVTDAAFSPVIVNKNVKMLSPGVIASEDNEQSGKTFFLKGTLASTRDNISPVIDLERASVITVANRIDNPVGAPGQDGYNTVDDYTAETDARNGSAQAKYVTKVVKLSEPADGVRMYLDVNRPTGTWVDVYYRTSDDEDGITAIDWTEASPTQDIPYNDAASYSETVYEIDPTGIFTVFEIKIVLRSKNNARVPTCKDLRVIALQP